jgi:DNA-binding NtrC family response regulator
MGVDREEMLKGKRVLIVDDEPDILGSLEELLDMCELHKASDYEGAMSLLQSKEFDAAILDIMGVRGYDLLDETIKRGIPTLMLTAHALSADNFVKSIRSGAHAYVPKDKISEISTFLADVLEEAAGEAPKRKRWFERLEDFFEQKFGEYWKDKEDPEFWKKYFYM